jgi:hypothetical protein
MLKAKGKFIFEKNGFIRIILHSDFCRYYKAFFQEAHYFTKKLQIPKHGAHINVYSSKIYGSPNAKKFKELKAEYDGKEVEFYYDVEGNYGGFTKGFLNFWLNVKCDSASHIADELGAFHTDEKYSRFHITIGNTKNINT